MAIRRKRIAAFVDDLLNTNSVKQPPIPVDRIVRSLGLVIRKDDNTETDISGFILRQGQDVFIGVNASTSSTRQRFTIAHELGHFLLHAAARADSLHIDRAFDIKFRNELSGQGIDEEEQEANLFAAELLMPGRFLADDWAQRQAIDLEDDETIKTLAKRYQVSPQAMTFRLANLGYLHL